MKSNQSLVRVVLFSILAMVWAGVSAGCSTTTTSDNMGDQKSVGMFPQTARPLVVDPAHPPLPEARMVSVYEDMRYGKTEVRDDNYIRHQDPASPTGWTPWHYRTAPHNWGDMPARMPAPATGSMVYSAFAYPDGNINDAVVLVKRQAPAEVAVGQAYTEEMTVANQTEHKLCDVMVRQQLAPDFTFVSADPQPNSVTKEELRWNLGDMGPKETRTIKVTGKAAKVGSVKDCVCVTYVPCTCLAVNVIQPQLTLSKTMPTEALQCDLLPVKFVVANTGSGVARNVMLKDTLPEGLMTEDRRQMLEMSLGDISPGQSREMTVNLRASRTGKLTNAATVTGDGGLTADATAAITIRKPVLKITKTGPDKLFLGRDLTYQITVSNEGDGVAKDVRLEDPIPQGAQVATATEKATTDGSRLAWNLGELAPKASKTVEVTMKVPAAATIRNTATARAYCAEPVSATVQTVVAGIPAVLLEVVDSPDPVELGKTTTYIITVTNQGSAPDTNINLACEMENSMEYVSSAGATEGKVDGRTITFAPLGKLDPKAQATWKVVVKAVKEGDVRFKTTMTTDQAKRPVEETEATNFYK